MRRFPGSWRARWRSATAAGFEARRAESAKRGKLRGLGIANAIERAAGPGPEYAELRFNTGGQATLLMGTIHQGQGHETTFKQIAIEKLGLAPTDIRFVQGDTDLVAFGTGTNGSRSTVIGGTAVTLAADKIIVKTQKDRRASLGSRRGRCAIREWPLHHSRHRSRPRSERGRARRVPAAASSRKAWSPGFTRPAPSRRRRTRSRTAAISARSSSIPTPARSISRAMSSSTMSAPSINPKLLKGQIQGGIAQGAGQALMEQVVYDPQSGQLLSASFMDYAMPKADDFCDIVIESRPVPTKLNPLGAKGAGEAGRSAPYPRDARDPRCAAAARGHAIRHARHTRARLAGDPSGEGRVMRTGAAYREALRDGRRVWVLGEGRVDDVTTHPATAPMVAEYVTWYDRLKDPAWRDLAWTPEGASVAYMVPLSADDLVRMGRFFSATTFLGAGNITHTPAYGHMIALGIQHAVTLRNASEAQVRNANAYRAHIAATGRFVTFAAGHATIGYRLRPDPAERNSLRIVRELDAGLVIAGKIGMHTSPAFAEDVDIGAGNNVDYQGHRATFAVAVNSPGVTVICRKRAPRETNPFAAPLKNRFDELDGQMWDSTMRRAVERVFLTEPTAEPIARWLFWHQLYCWLAKAEFSAFCDFSLACTQAMDDGTSLARPSTWSTGSAMCRRWRSCLTGLRARSVVHR